LTPLDGHQEWHINKHLVATITLRLWKMGQLGRVCVLYYAMLSVIELIAGLLTVSVG